MTKWFFIVFLFVVAFAAIPAEAATQLPNYAQGGNLTSQVQSKGKAITDLLSLICAILSIIGMVIGATMIGIGKPESGKVTFICGVLGIILAGSIYGIAALVA